MNTGFGQSCRGYVLLSYLGYPKVKILHGGYVAWTAAGMPTSTAVPTPSAEELPARSRRHGHPGRPAEHEGGGRRPEHRQARHPRRRRVDCRFVLALRQGLLPAQGPHPRRGVDRMVPDDEALAGGPDVQIARRNPRRMRDRRRHAVDAGGALLLQGRARLEHAGRAERGRHRERHALFRFLERMVARSVAADRDRASHTRRQPRPASRPESTPTQTWCRRAGRHRGLAT